MKTLFSSILLIDSIIAFYLALSPIWQRKKLDAANRTLHIYALASAIWSLGFGMLFLQTDVEKAYYWRSFAILGTILYMITAQYLICLFSNISPRRRNLFNVVAYTGIIPYFLSIHRDQTEYFMSPIGMTYRFKPGPVNMIYTFYFALVSVNIIICIIHMIRSATKKRFHVLGIHFLRTSILILLGTILDMAFPALGFPALPGSNITQFLGLVIMFYAMNGLNQTKINVSNMSKFIYYSLAMPVLVFDDHYKLRIANEAATEFFSLPKEDAQLHGYRIVDLFPLEESQFYHFQGLHSSHDSICILNQTPCNLTVSRIQDDYNDTTGYIVNVQDLSERVQYIENLKKARLEADSSNRAKSAFLANMSHEIRTPMNAIIGFTELALQEDVPLVLTNYLEDIKTSSHNLMALINNILDISKIESGKMELINVQYQTADFLNSIYRIILTQASQKGLDFQITVDPKLPQTLSGDTNKLRNILINLLNNAVKYTPKGRILFDVQCSDPHQAPFLLTFRISDSGIGIKEEDMNKLFEVFTQVDSSTNYGKEGTGLGLSLVKGYCELMNGTVSVESKYGIGSTFIATVEQTVVDSTPCNSDFISSSTIKDDFSFGTLRLQNVKALIVDDNALNRKVISRSMSHYGMDVDIASTGAESIVMCQNTLYDFVFMDQMMPEMDGIEAMKRIRQLNTHYALGSSGKIVVLTANAIAGVRETLLSEGFDEYLSKPINHRDLTRILEMYL